MTTMMKSWIACAKEEVELIYMLDSNNHFEVISDGLYVTREYDGDNLEKALTVYFEYLLSQDNPRFFINGMELSWR